HERAADLYREWIGIVLSNVQGVRRSTRLVACYHGASAAAFDPWRALVDDWWPQPNGSLGSRLDAAFSRWQAESRPAIAIGTDCLEVDANHVESAFDILRENDVVFGPAIDGGYYLVGLVRYLPSFFHGIPWSTPATLAAHQSVCERQGWSFGLLPTLRDIDTLEDWKEYERRRNEQT
ncbi:MAG: TIGR04282 family arsenosugar biosynthesis glycosyltransferase, partial [Planctomycetia bacterium]|nr:TIGR04282 family arsenosugar biosynthesis glycosyltransferase [Planctomycetia bacterium]